MKKGQSETEKQEKQNIPNQWVLFSDLLGLTALFTAIFYMSGYVYIKVYYNQFYLSLDAIEWNLTSCMVTFIDQVILKNNWYRFTSIFLVLLFAGGFYVSRRLKSSLAGYSLLCILTVILFAISTLASSHAAHRAVSRDWNSRDSTLPRILVKPTDTELLDRPLAIELQRKSLRLLYESEEYLYLVRTESSPQGSDLPVYVFPKSQLIMFEMSQPEKGGN
jgi:hypothetical protein